MSEKESIAESNKCSLAGPCSGHILSRLENPYDVSGLNPEELPLLAQELRDCIIRNVANSGGHLAPSLGVVELTIALLRLLNPQKDKIIWDVGHQAYAYKILTGRAGLFHTLRQQGGLSGFPRIAESPYDHFGVGHSSTSISAALGMAMARDLAGQDHHVLAVIGDGALTSGLAYEAMNQAGALGKRLIVVLNDNEMSISRNVGALSFFFSRKTYSRWGRRVKREVEDFLHSIPGIGEDMLAIAKRSKNSFKTFFTPGILFEAMRFKYIGPVNGHDFSELETGLQLAASLDEPVVLHVLTQKGKGYAPAEEDPTCFHGIGCFDSDSGELLKTDAKDGPSYTSVFSEALCELAEVDPRIVAITAAMPEGTGLSAFAKRFPTRFVDVGICEPHAVTFAAGLATQGMRPVVAVYSTFMQRAYDQIVHDVCLQNLPVTLCLDRSGLVGEDGATHHGAFDISYLRHIPGLAILAPRDQKTLKQALASALALNAPVAIRYPRGCAPAIAIEAVTPPFPKKVPEVLPDVLPKDDLLKAGLLPVGRGQFVRLAAHDNNGKKRGKLALIAVGVMLAPALAAAEALHKEGLADISVFDPVWLKPMDKESICALAEKNQGLAVLEENALPGGFGSAVLELLSESGLTQNCQVYRHGLPDAFVEHGKSALLRQMLELDAEGIANWLKRCL